MSACLQSFHVEWAEAFVPAHRQLDVPVGAVECTSSATFWLKWHWYNRFLPTDCALGVYCFETNISADGQHWYLTIVYQLLGLGHVLFELFFALRQQPKLSMENPEKEQGHYYGYGTIENIESGSFDLLVDHPVSNSHSYVIYWKKNSPNECMNCLEDRGSSTQTGWCSPLVIPQSQESVNFTWDEKQHV